MATLKTIRKRITSVKNTQKITRAMKMVAAAKLRRAQMALTSARPHGDVLQKTLERLLEPETAPNFALLKKVEDPQKAQIVVFTSDRGLCGGFNGNLLRQVENFLKDPASPYASIEVSSVGKKGRDYYRAKRREVQIEEAIPAEKLSFEAIRPLAEAWAQKFKDGEFDVLYIAYNSFKSAISQVPTIQQVLPLKLEISEELKPQTIWEGNRPEILNDLLKRYLTTLFYLAILESQASEMGSRMSAMENATNNAKDMIGQLTLQYNRARQATITTELMDIVNGAEALG